MRHAHRVIAIAGLLSSSVYAQNSFTWQQLKDKFESANPILKAALASVDESKAAEVTAYLRPNPSLTGTLDQINPFSTQASPSGSGQNVYRPLANALPYGSVSYLHERQHQRELRLESARKTTDVTVSSAVDQQRGLFFTLRNAFVQTLQAKAVLQNAVENLAYWDQELDIDRKRLAAGDIAPLDLSRLELLRAQFESDFETAMVNLRTSKIQLLQLINDRTPLDQFDVNGTFDFSDHLTPLDDYRNTALAARPDLRAALQSVELAKTNHALAVANGATDPTFTVDFARNPPIPSYFGLSVSIPLRIFDRNQGEKARTQIDIGRNERLRDAAQAQVFNDVDSSYWTLVQALNLLRPYKATYLAKAADIRDKVAFSYKNGGAALLDYLDAEKAYRDTRLAYLNLVGSYLVAAAQMNLAVGQEVIQ
jgi:cobalt-zinc-cadmium efflux system outer membrane protein